MIIYRPGSGAATASTVNRIVNVTNWAAYLILEPTVGVDDAVIYEGVFYQNKTGAQISSSPDADAINWEVLDIGPVIPPSSQIKTNDYTIVGSDNTILVDASANTVDISMPATPSHGQIFNVYCINDSFACTVVRNGNNINGVAGDIALMANESLTLQFNTTYGWVIL